MLRRPKHSKNEVVAPKEEEEEEEEEEEYYIHSAVDECFVLFITRVRVTIRQPVGQSVHPSRCGPSPGSRDKILCLCIGKYYRIVLGRSILFMHLVYVSLDEGLTQENRRTGRTQTYCHTASGILTV
jgi:hypothetical protein